MRKSLLIAAVSALSCGAGAVEIPEALPRKCIAAGWEFGLRKPADYVEHAEWFAKAGIDGVVMSFSEVDHKRGINFSTQNMWSDSLWPKGQFDRYIPDLKKMSELPGLKDSMTMIMRCPTNRLDWLDDARWTVIAANVRNLAHTMAAGGLKGFNIDQEDYYQQHHFERQWDEPPYETLAPIVRRRAAQVFRGLFEEQPQAVLMSAWLLSWKVGIVPCGNPSGALADEGNLWVPFVNGILDVLPPTAIVIDGNEWAYDYENDAKDYRLSTINMRETALALVAPENRLKYRAQVRAGFGHYLEKYVQQNPKHRYYCGPVEGSRLRHLERNLTQSLECSGGYVWFWGEAYCWVPWKKGTYRGWHVNEKTWEEWLPGLGEMIRSVTKPNAYMREKLAALKREGRLVNLVCNAEMRIDRTLPTVGYNVISNGFPKPYGVWQETAHWRKLHAGTFGVDTSTGDGDSSSFSTEGVGEGCFTYEIPNVKPGELYAVGVSAKGELPTLSVGWKKGGQWRFYVPGTSIALDRTRPNGWRCGIGWARIPDDIDGMVVKLGLHNTLRGRTWFDNLRVYRLTGDPYPDAKK